MRRNYLRAMAVAAFAILAGYNVYLAQPKTNDEMSDAVLENIEALSQSEGGQSYGCGYAVYEADDDWYEDTKKFNKCMRGCPEDEGTSPKYIWC